MAKLLSKQQRIQVGVKNPGSEMSRVFGLACKANAGVGNNDFAYSPVIGQKFWLKYMSLWFGGGDPTTTCAGTIYISYGTEIPTGEIVATRWEIIVPFWAGTTKPAIMLQGQSGYLWWPMNRLFTGQPFRFGMSIENGVATRPWWVNAWFEISEG